MASSLDHGLRADGHRHVERSARRRTEKRRRRDAHDGERDAIEGERLTNDAGFAAEAKEAAQGAAILADGLAGGRYRDLVARLRLREAAGSALDYLAIPGVEGVKAAYGLE